MPLVISLADFADDVHSGLACELKEMLEGCYIIDENPYIEFIDRLKELLSHYAVSSRSEN